MPTTEEPCTCENNEKPNTRFTLSTAVVKLNLDKIKLKILSIKPLCVCVCLPQKEGTNEKIFSNVLHLTQKSQSKIPWNNLDLIYLVVTHWQRQQNEPSSRQLNQNWLTAKSPILSVWYNHYFNSLICCMYFDNTDPTLEYFLTQVDTRRKVTLILTVKMDAFSSSILTQFSPATVSVKQAKEAL